MKWIKNHCKIFIILCILVLLLMGFGIYNLVWYQATTTYWGKFLEKVERSPEFSEHEVYSITDEEGITYLVKKPNYLSCVGNLSISYPIDDKPVTLLIWPKKDDIWEYGVRINSEDGGEFYLGEDMRALDKRDEEAVKKYYPDIDYLYKKAKALWEL